MRVLLIRKDFKLGRLGIRKPSKFESLVNKEGFQTIYPDESERLLFESLVNTEGFQTQIQTDAQECEFESLVNTEGFQTANCKDK